MDVNVTLATYSNYLVYGAMAAYTVAMIAFAVSLAATKGRDLVPAAAGSEQAAAGSVAASETAKAIIATVYAAIAPYGRCCTSPA